MAWGETACMPRCSSAQRSRQVVTGVRGVCDDVTSSFLHSEVVQALKAGQVDTNYPFYCPNSPLQSSNIWFTGWPKPDSYSGAQNRFNNSRVKLCHATVTGWTFFSWRRKYNLRWAFFTMESMWVSTSGPERWWFPGTWMTPLQPQRCSWWWVGGEKGGFSWSPLSSLQFWVCQAPGCCDSTRQPAAQPFVYKQTHLHPGWDWWLWCHLQTSGVWQRGI